MQIQTEKAEIIVAHIALKFELNKKILLGHFREKKYIRARFICMAILRNYGMSYTAIAKMFNRDHSSIIHAVKSAGSLYQNDIDSFKIVLNKVDLSGIEHKNPYANGKSKKWAWLYKLYNGKCAICGFSEVVQVHHLIPVSIGGTDDVSNVLVVCPNHHALLHLGLVDISNLSTRILDNPHIHTHNSNNKD